MLLNIAQTRRVAVVVTNHQMHSSHDSIFGRAIPIGGYIISYASTYRIRLRRLSPEKFCVALDISSCHSQSNTDFAIHQRGVMDAIDEYSGNKQLSQGEGYYKGRRWRWQLNTYQQLTTTAFVKIPHFTFQHNNIQ